MGDQTRAGPRAVHIQAIGSPVGTGRAEQDVPAVPAVLGPAVNSQNVISQIFSSQSQNVVFQCCFIPKFPGGVGGGRPDPRRPKGGANPSHRVPHVHWAGRTGLAGWTRQLCNVVQWQIKIAIKPPKHLSVISQAAAWLLVAPWRGTGDQARANDAAQVISGTSVYLGNGHQSRRPGVGVCPPTTGSLRFRGSAPRGRAVPPEDKAPTRQSRTKALPVFPLLFYSLRFFFGKNCSSFGRSFGKLVEQAVTHA